MNGFRVDRRSAALRGGTFPVLVPGSSATSRFYLKLLGPRFGQQMPPTGPLPPEQVEIIGRWIDEGAAWPDEVAGELPAMPPDPAAVRLMDALRRRDTAASRRQLTDNPAAALGNALRAGCRACADLVVHAVDRRGLDEALQAVAIRGDEAAVRLLLDRGAGAGAANAAGMTALMQACASDFLPAGIVRLLIERGADVNAATRDGRTALDFAFERNDPRILGALTAAGARRGKTALVDVPAPMPSHSPRAAVERALPLLQRTDVAFTEKAGCLSCHHDALTAWTVTRARTKGLRVDETIVASQRRHTLTYLESWRERALRGVGLAGGSTTVGYVLLGLGAEGHPADALTDAYAVYLVSRQLADGRMRVSAHRPPQEASDVTATAVALRGIALYGGPQAQAPVAAAAKWLAGQAARSTEETVYQLLGLAWSGQYRDRLHAIGQKLLAEQRDDGGWSGLPALASDAYATGQALVALREAGIIAASHPAYRRGVEFLLRTQLADGSWHVRSRSMPQQAYFERGFPHGVDQFISAAATNWATLALLETLP